MTGLNYKKICDFIESNEGYTHEQLNVKSRKRELVFVRQLCMYFCLRKTKVTLDMIAKYYTRDHATVIHAEKTINNLFDTDSSIREKINLYDSHFIKTKNGLFFIFPILPDTIDLKELRLIAGVTQYKAAKGIPIPRSSLCRIENEINELETSYNTIKKIVNYYKKMFIQNNKS